jgi:hypothetical protein
MTPVVVPDREVATGRCHRADPRRAARTTPVPDRPLASPALRTRFPALRLAVDPTELHWGMATGWCSAGSRTAPARSESAEYVAQVSPANQATTAAVCCHGRSGQGREQSPGCVGRPVEQDQGGVVLELSVLVGEDGGGEPAQCFGCG